MTIQAQIQANIASQPEPKRANMETLHQLILSINPTAALWFLDGKDSEGKVVSNPNIGYGTHTIQYANGSSKAFYKIGMSANTTGISIYIMGVEDKNYLAKTYGKTLGKASISGYCIKFKRLSDLDLDTLKSVIADGFES